MSPENKARLKKAAKIAGGVGAAGLAAGAAYAKKDEIGDYAKKGVEAAKKALNIGDGSGAKMAGDRPNTTPTHNPLNTGTEDKRLAPKNPETTGSKLFNRLKASKLAKTVSQ
jgi:hypothetical protein